MPAPSNKPTTAEMDLNEGKAREGGIGDSETGRAVAARNEFTGKAARVDKKVEGRGGGGKRGKTGIKMRSREEEAEEADPLP